MQIVQEDEEGLHEAVYQMRKKNGWYDPWYRKVRMRYTRQTTPLYLYPVITFHPYLKAIGICFWKHVWQISFNNFGNDGK